MARNMFIHFTGNVNQRYVNSLEFRIKVKLWLNMSDEQMLDYIFSHSDMENPRIINYSRFVKAFMDKFYFSYD